MIDFFPAQIAGQIIAFAVITAFLFGFVLMDWRSSPGRCTDPPEDAWRHHCRHSRGLVWTRGVGGNFGCVQS